MSKIELSLSEAIKEKNVVEIAVQNWYAAMIKIDLHEYDAAEINLLETRRLDEHIMNRIPGLAWLKVAEYHYSRRKHPDSIQTKIKKRGAYQAMEDLGMKNIDDFLEWDYYF